MSEWTKSETSVYDEAWVMPLGPVILRVQYLEVTQNWVIDFAGAGCYMTRNGGDIEQVKAEALAWARQVLGQALVEAGAETTILIRCEECEKTGAAPPYCHCAGHKPAATYELKYARID